jgi:hypothetical protein
VLLEDVGLQEDVETSLTKSPTFVKKNKTIEEGNGESIQLCQA